MAAAARGRRPVAVVCVDVDDFQRLNDVFEAATGDEVLIVLADRLVPMLRPGDVLARLGGDEYGILLEDSTEAGARTVAERMLGAIRLPMRIGGREIEVSASAGLALSQPGDDAEILLRNAESALTVAKQRGGDRLALCHPTAEPAPTEPRGADAPHDRFVHLRMAQEAAVAANASDRLEEAAGVVMRQLCSHVGCAMAHLWVSTGDTPPTLSSSVWHIADANDQGRFQDASRQLSFASGIGLPGRVLASGVPAWIPDLASDPNWLRGHEGLEAGLESGGAFPLLIGREVAAVVELFFRSRTEASRLFLDVLAGIGIQLGRVLERQRAFETLHRATEELRASQDTCGTPTTRPS
jgi:diguanylate cyclase (GGDEF)-like protein